MAACQSFMLVRQFGSVWSLSNRSPHMKKKEQTPPLFFLLFYPKLCHCRPRSPSLLSKTWDTNKSCGTCQWFSNMVVCASSQNIRWSLWVQRNDIHNVPNFPGASRPSDTNGFSHTLRFRLVAYQDCRLMEVAWSVDSL